MIRFILNENEVTTSLPPGTLLLDYIRYHRQLMGTKIGCREGDCGACTVLVGELKAGKPIYTSATSCLMALANAEGKHIVTVEGFNLQGLNPVQQAMNDEGATQCGFCTPGFIVSLAGFCLSDTENTYEQAIASVNGNICRCTGYKSIERAVKKISELMSKKKGDAIAYLTENEMLPSYFTTIQSRLEKLLAETSPPNTHGGRFLGGGTDLYVQQPEGRVDSSIYLLASKPGIKNIEEDNGVCYVGGGASVTDIISSPVFQKHFPYLHKFVKLVSSTPIRNMATVGGNIVNASPIGDLTIFFLALDAQLLLSDGNTERVVALRNFYKGYKQMDKKADEFIKQVFFPLPPQSFFSNFEKVSKRTHLDIASVNSAALLVAEDGKILQAAISAGGVGPIPIYLKKTSEFLAGNDLNEDVVLKAIEIVQTEISPISDVRGSEDYKRLLLSQLIKAHFIEAFPSLPVEKLV